MARQGLPRKCEGGVRHYAGGWIGKRPKHAVPRALRHLQPTATATMARSRTREEVDAHNPDILKINYGTHYDKIFYIERITHDNICLAEYFVYDQVKDKYVRFTVDGGNLVVWLNHGMKSRPVVPVKATVKVWGIIPIQMNLERIIKVRNYKDTYVE